MARETKQINKITYILINHKNKKMVKVTKKNIGEQELTCHDCGKALQEGDMCVPYDVAQKTFYKCDKCFAKDESLRNFQETEVYSRIVGYIRPVKQWNVGKTEEYADRKEYCVDAY